MKFFEIRRTFLKMIAKTRLLYSHLDLRCDMRVNLEKLKLTA